MKKGFKTLSGFRCQADNCCDRDHCNDQKLSASSLREEAIRWLEDSKGDINTADWVEFFNLEDRFGHMCLNNSVDDVVSEDRE